MTSAKSSLKSLLNQEEKDKELRIKSHEGINNIATFFSVSEIF
jgi:hypothetical protein